MPARINGARARAREIAVRKCLQEGLKVCAFASVGTRSREYVKWVFGGEGEVKNGMGGV